MSLWCLCRCCCSWLEKFQRENKPGVQTTAKLKKNMFILNILLIHGLILIWGRSSRFSSYFKRTTKYMKYDICLGAYKLQLINTCNKHNINSLQVLNNLSYAVLCNVFKPCFKEVFIFYIFNLLYKPFIFTVAKKIKIYKMEYNECKEIKFVIVQ